MAAGFFLLAAPLVLAAILADTATAAWANATAALLLGVLGLVLAVSRPPA